MHLQLILASLIWGLNIVVMKLTLISVPPYHLAIVRVLLSCLVLYVIARWQHVPLTVSYRQLPGLGMIGLLNVSLNFGLSFYGLQLLEGNQVALLNTLSPLIMCLVTWQAPTSWASLALCLFGFYTSIHYDLSVFQTGHFYILLSLACYQLSLARIQKLSMDRLVISFWSMLLGGLLLLGPAYVLEGWAWGSFLSLSLSQWFWFGLFSVVGFALIQLIYIKAGNRMSMVAVGFYMNLAPVFTYLGSLIFLHERFDLFVGLGMGMVLVSLYWSKKSAQRALSS